MRLIAGPESTGWVIAAYISLAPAFFKAAAASTKLDAVATRSSIIITFFPLISPNIFIASVSSPLTLLLSTIASGALNLFAYALAIFIPPTSGETTTISLIFILLI